MTPEPSMKGSGIDSYDLVISVDCEECAECEEQGKTCNAETWKTTMEFDDWGHGYCETQCPSCKHIRTFEREAGEE